MLERSRILVVEDNIELQGIIADFLEVKEAVADFASDGDQGFKLAMKNDFDAIILDVMLPKLDGMQVATKLRQNGVTTPILMLTALNGQEDLLNSFDSGADDFVTKPFKFPELEARLCALIKRNKGLVAQKTLSYGEVMINEKTHTASRDGQTLTLTPILFQILRELVKAQGGVVSRESLIFMLWGDDIPDKDVLRSHIYLLRNVLDKPFKFPMLKTIPKHGFQLILSASEPQ
ncbi:response regulator transcription factor [Vibrio sp. L5-1]|uniref:Chemotaxis protein CheY n=1 Tax=Vibrio splendidus TaxID=29497 RepID=A0A837P219_VIBSP|nr:MULTISPECIES: response regulator transcription factor [Vibrio]KPL96582.1 chemotaxis protein CheY [Vibrio splendidus]MCF7494565.1 response regulator transcription factor [Vibrio sp. L5-1]NOJ04387.1 response regulator transcription factor [Vibrio splendidus]